MMAGHNSGEVYTMQLSRSPVKFVIGCWARPMTTTLVYTKGNKMSKWPWSSRSPQDIFEGLHYPLTWSNKVLRWERQKKCFGRKRQGRIAHKHLHNKSSMNFLFMGKGRWRQENDRTWIFSSSSKTTLFGHIFKTINTFNFWCTVILLGPHSVYT
jgi:hypothetical protein